MSRIALLEPDPDARNIDTVPTKHKHHFKLAYEHSGGGFISFVCYIIPLLFINILPLVRFSCFDEYRLLQRYYQ